MASEVPGWCKQCGTELVHLERPQGRAREFCNSACRQRFSRAQRLRKALAKEVGLSEEQVHRLLSLFTVTPKAGGAARSTASGGRT